jgi:hypothetical protein
MPEEMQMRSQMPGTRQALHLSRGSAVVLAALMLVAAAVGPVSAAAPDNDLPAGATVIPSLPFAIDQDTTDAGVGADDVGCGAGGLDAATVWYSFLPAEDVRVEIDARASDFLGVNLFAGTADEAGRFDCNNDALAFDASAGTTYYVLFADVNDDGVNGGTLRAEVRVAPPSLNVTLTVNPTAKVHPKTGQALVTGTIACDRQAEFAEVGVTLRLETGRFTTIGAGAASTSCGADPGAWTALVDGENGRFVGGAGTVRLTGFACDILSCNETAIESSIRLRRGVFELPEAAVGGAPTLVQATAPANDDMASPTIVGSIPFTDSLDTTGATIGATDPGYCFAPEIGPDPASVWYSYAADASGPLLASTFGSEYDTTLYVGTADGAGGIQVLGCSDDTRSHESAVRFDAVAGETYLFAVSASPFGGSVGGNLVFNLDVGPPAQAVELHVDPTGSFDGYGTATIRGTVSCAAPAPLGAVVIVELMQRVGNHELPSTSFLDIEGCPAKDIAFEAKASSPYGKYRGGHATAQVIFAACSDFECGSETVDLQIRLRR